MTTSHTAPPAADAAPIARIERVTKRYATRVAVADLSFDVPPGKTVGLLGPNGAGKTSTIRMIVNILRPDEGRITINGIPTGERTKRFIGYLPEERGLYKNMKIGALLEFFGRLHGLDARTARERARLWLERVGMLDRADQLVSSLSKGLSQKVQFAATLVHQPSLLILDEVFSGLDPVNVKRIRDELKRLHREGMAILFSTHVLEQAEQLCDYVVMLKDGRAHIQGETAEVKARFGSDVYVVAPEREEQREAIAALPMVATSETFATHVKLRLAEGATPRDLLERLVAEGITPRRFERTDMSLTDIFIEHIGDLKPDADEEEGDAEAGGDGGRASHRALAAAAGE